MWKKRISIQRSKLVGTGISSIIVHNLEHILIPDQEEFEDTKGVIRICKSKNDRQRNGQKKNGQKDKQRSTHKTKDRVTRTPLKTVGELGCFGRVAVPSPLLAPVFALSPKPRELRERPALPRLIIIFGYDSTRVWARDIHATLKARTLTIIPSCYLYH